MVNGWLKLEDSLWINPVKIDSIRLVTKSTSIDKFLKDKAKVLDPILLDAMCKSTVDGGYYKKLRRVNITKIFEMDIERIVDNPKKYGVDMPNLLKQLQFPGEVPGYLVEYRDKIYNLKELEFYSEEL